MKAWYTSQKRFSAKIRLRWDKTGFRHHAGHIQLLKYSYRTLMYYSSLKRAKISKVNKVNTDLKLF